MDSKNIELIAAKEKLAKLIDELHVRERQLDEALQHAASYMGNDDRIEEVRDDMARSAYESVVGVKNEIANLAKLIEALVAANAK